MAPFATAAYGPGDELWVTVRTHPGKIGHRYPRCVMVEGRPIGWAFNSGAAMVRPVILGLLFFVFLSPTASAEEQSLIEAETDPVIQMAMNTWHHEMVECAAFYSYSMQGFKPAGKKKEVRSRNQRRRPKRRSEAT